MYQTKTNCEKRSATSKSLQRYLNAKTSVDERARHFISIYWGSKKTLSQQKDKSIDEEVNNLETTLNQYRIKLKSINEELDGIDIDSTQVVHAENDVVIESVFTKVGDILNEKGPIFSYHTIESNYIEANVPDAFMSIINRAIVNKVKLNATVYSEKIQKKVTLSQILPISDNTAGPKAVFYFDNLENIDTENNTLLVRLALPRIPRSYAVPQSVIYDNNRIYTVTKNNKLKVHTVQVIGKTIDDKGQSMLLIRSKDNLHNFHVVASRLPYILTGMTVKVKNA